MTSVLKNYELGIYRKSLSAFVQGAFKIVSPNDTYYHSWYIDLICEYLMQCYEKKTRRLIINIPPRHMKSLIVNVAFPAWLLGKSPTEKILAATYSHGLLKEHAVSFNRLMKSDWYQSIFPETIIERESIGDLGTTAGGCRYATTVGSTLTGKGGNYIIIDDPMNAIDASRQIERERVRDWFSFSLASRQNQQDSVMVLIAQRLHEDDLSGVLMQDPDWTVLKLPAIAEHDETFEINGLRFGRREGEVLNAKRMGHQFYDKQRKVMDAYGWAGQYQQRPVPRGGGEFKKEWLQHYDGVLDHQDYTKFLCVDPASSKKTTSDYTAMVVLGLSSDENIYVLDMIRDRLNLSEREDALFSLHAKYKPRYVLYERYGMQVDVEYLRAKMNERNYRFPITEVGGRLLKEDRIRRLVPYAENSRLYLPTTLTRTDYEGVARDLTAVFEEEEYATFPVGKHDDILDCMSRVFDFYQNGMLVFPTLQKIDYTSLTRKITLAHGNRH